MKQEDYNRHFDATAAKGLCWCGCGRQVLVQRIKLSNGRFETVESLWCFECRIDEDVIDATNVRQ